MDRLLEQVKQTIADTLKVDIKTIADDATQDDVAAWDSMGHLNIIMELERRFSVSFSTEEAINSLSIPKIIETLKGKLNGS